MEVGALVFCSTGKRSHKEPLWLIPTLVKRERVPALLKLFCSVCVCVSVCTVYKYVDVCVCAGVCEHVCVLPVKSFI